MAPESLVSGDAHEAGRGSSLNVGSGRTNHGSGSAMRHVEMMLGNGCRGREKGIAEVLEGQRLNDSRR